MENKLKMANNHFTSKQLWNSYAILNPNREIKEVVKKNFDKTVEFVDVPDAEQYRVSQRMRSESAQNHSA